MEKRSSNVMKSSSSKKGNVSPFPLEEVSGARFNTQTANYNKISENGPCPDGQIGGRLSRIERDAYKQGFLAGEQAGRELGLKKLEPTKKMLSNIIGEVTHLKAVILNEIEDDIINISLAIARRIVGDELKENRDILLINIQKAIKKIGQTEKLMIRLHPNDLERIAQETEDLIASLKDGHLLRFEPDTRLDPGDCIVEGQDRVVDARPKVQIKIIEEKLRRQR